MLTLEALANARGTMLSGTDEPDRDKKNREEFAAFMQAENARSSVAAQVKADSAAIIAAHNAAVLAMVGDVPDAKQEFLDFMSKTPEERMREQILLSLGLTEEDLEAMEPDERLAVEQKIADIFKEQARQTLEEQMKESAPDPTKDDILA